MLTHYLCLSMQTTALQRDVVQCGLFTRALSIAFDDDELRSAARAAGADGDSVVDGVGAGLLVLHNLDDGEWTRRQKDDATARQGQCATDTHNATRDSESSS